MRSDPGLRAWGAGRDSCYLGGGGWCVGSTFSHRNLGLSQRTTCLSDCVRTTWNVFCCESWTSYADDLNFKRNIMCLLGEVYWKRKQKFLSVPKSEEIKVAQNHLYSRISKAQRKSNFLFKRILRLKSLCRRSCHEPAQFAMPQVWAEVGWGQLWGRTHPACPAAHSSGELGGGIYKSWEN